MLARSWSDNFIAYDVRENAKDVVLYGYDLFQIQKEKAVCRTTIIADESSIFLILFGAIKTIFNKNDVILLEIF